MINRRKFIGRTALLGVAGVLGPTAYGFWEAEHLRVTRRDVSVRNLPEPFVGKTLAVLADLHHGPYVSLSFVRKAVQLTNSLHPDLIALVGDYAHTGNKTHIELPPCLEALSALSAPLGVFAVPGNHDMKSNGAIYHEVIASTPLLDVTNQNRSVELEGEKLWLAGVDDLWWGKPDLMRALLGVPERAAVVLLSHNPDFAELVQFHLMRSGVSRMANVSLTLVGFELLMDVAEEILDLVDGSQSRRPQPSLDLGEC